MEVREGASIPAELAAWHQTVSAWDNPVTAQDYPVPYSKLSKQEDGMMVFWVENQGGYVWAVDLTSETHVVFMGDPGDEGSWDSTGLTLDEFLIYVTLTEAILGSEHKVFVPSLPAALAHSVLGEFTPLGLFSRADPDPACRIYIGEDALAQITTPPSGYPAGEENVGLNLAAIDGDSLQRHLAKIEPRYLVWGPFNETDEDAW
jgi:hypothetical protein